MDNTTRGSIYSRESHQTKVIRIASFQRSTVSESFPRFFIKSIQLFLVSICLMFSFNGSAQNFEISTNVCDSLSPTSYFIHVSGYGTFTDSMVMTIELISADSLGTVAYSGSKDFGVNGLNTLTNFSYDASTEEFSLDIGTYSSRVYRVRVQSWVNSVMKEELILDTY